MNNSIQSIDVNLKKSKNFKAGCSERTRNDKRIDAAREECKFEAR
jgi:hypothetical protein